jgi:cytochrome c oxidase subunit 1
VRDLYPRWTAAPDQPVVTGLAADHREVLVTNVMDAEPDHRHPMPGPSLAPLAVALATGVGFIAVIFTPWGLVYGGALALPGLAAWFWKEPPS